MYARVTNFKVDPSRLRSCRPRSRRWARAPRPCRAWSTPTPHGAATAKAWSWPSTESKEDADRAVARIQALWGDLAGLLSGAPRTDAYENAAHITG